MFDKWNSVRAQFHRVPIVRLWPIGFIVREMICQVSQAWTANAVKNDVRRPRALLLSRDTQDYSFEPVNPVSNVETV